MALARLFSGRGPAGFAAFRRSIESWVDTDALYKKGERAQICKEVSAFFGEMQTGDLCVAQPRDGNSIGVARVYYDPAVTILIFVLPKGGSLPFHDHPDMSVVGRVLYGTLQVTSCDLPSGSGDSDDRPWDGGTWTTDAIREQLGGGDVFEIGPERRNVHHLVALEDSAFIDFTFPSYGTEGRNITYFRPEPISEDEIRLVVSPDALGYVTHEIPYRGPKLQG
jgi:quercetin dioxygenase-like cupin family protein